MYLGAASDISTELHAVVMWLNFAAPNKLLVVDVMVTSTRTI
jgi:hypothetical protein